MLAPPAKVLRTGGLARGGLCTITAACTKTQPTLEAHLIGAPDKKQVDIEALLQWAFLDELPKRILNATGESGERFWHRLEQYGSLGGIDIDEPSASVQRYAYVGEPHRDAVKIEAAVAALGSATVDWERDYWTIAAELAGLVGINGLVGRERQREMVSQPGAAYGAGAIARTHDGRGLRAVPIDPPRDVISVSSVNVAALVHTHAVWRTRPDWRSEPIIPRPMKAGRGFALVGECRGKNLYTEGSYTPLRWEPSPLSIVLERAEYFLWHQALTTLAETLQLAEHAPLKPAAPAAPWHEAEILRRTFKQTSGGKGFFLPFRDDEERPRASAPLRNARYSKVRYPLLDSGE